MSDMHEAVPLPDPAVKRLLHPTDVPEARMLYLRGWWFARLCAIPIAVAIGAVVWTFSGNLPASLAAPTSCFTIGFAASRWHQARAWDFIPRKRQDRDGADRWRLLAVAFDAVALIVTAVAVVHAINSAPISAAVAAYAVCSGLGVAVLQLVEITLAVIRRRNGASVTRGVILLVAVITAAGLVATLSSDVRDQDFYALAAAGAVTVLLAQSLWSLGTRRSRGGDR